MLPSQRILGLLKQCHQLPSHHFQILVKGFKIHLFAIMIILGLVDGIFVSATNFRLVAKLVGGLLCGVGAILICTLVLRRIFILLRFPHRSLYFLPTHKDVKGTLRCLIPTKSNNEESGIFYRRGMFETFEPENGIDEALLRPEADRSIVTIY